MVYEVKFERFATEGSMNVVLRRPFADEIEDYREYKRLRMLQREQPVEMGKSRAEIVGPTRSAVTDGAVDVDGELMAQEEMEDVQSDRLPEDVFHAEMMRHRLEFGRSDSAWE